MGQILKADGRSGHGLESSHYYPPSLSHERSAELPLQTDDSTLPADQYSHPAQFLAPVDRGRQAWSFLVAATLIEAFVWGLPFSVGVLHEYWVNVMFQGQGMEGTLTTAATL